MRRAALASVALSVLTVLSAIPAAPQAESLRDLYVGLAFAGATPGDPCPGAAATRFFDVVAIQVPVSYNHWGDFDPSGRLFVLASEEQVVRDQVAASLARAGLDTVARTVASPTTAVRDLGYVFLGPVAGVPRLERFDASPLVQPFVVRAHVGDCVQFNLTNKLPEPVSLHVHKAAAAPGAGLALGSEDADLALPGQTRSYVVYLPPLPGMEGAHFLHSHADARYQTKHGLFGALVAEPAGSSWLTPEGQPSLRGQEAIIVQPGASDFREYVVVLHDEVELLDHRLNPMPQLSSFGEYGPGSKAINLRTEPFMDRFSHHDEREAELGSSHDKSQGYGSYTYGDPAHFLPRAYVGDPTKFRLVNAGPGQHHVFHLHGGGDRWRASPVSDDTQFDIGLTKANPVNQSKSERVDVQNVGPGESFNLEIEGGAGGVQQSVGDFLYHCHIVEHYVAGMFAFWRVYNTLQPNLSELPDRAGGTPAAVDSVGLLGRRLPDGTLLDATTLKPWVASLLPPPGVPADTQDASVWDWTWEETGQGPLARGEPETTFVWPNYRSATPGERPTLQFHPLNGRLAYPHLTPHLGHRPPFAPEHGPAPYLGEVVDARHPDGLCPAGAPLHTYSVVALAVPVRYNDVDVDPDGQVFVLAEDKEAVESGAKAAKNLVLRANQGDCVDILFTSQLAEEGDQRSKVNLHIHLVQFDVQGSDGVIAGRNYETSIRPAATTGSALAQGAAAGNRTLTVEDASRFQVGTRIGIGLTLPSAELRHVTAVDGDEVTLDAPLLQDHAAGERVGHEFLRYRWYADVELGMVYWHDHVDGLQSWRHGLFGGLVVEPAGSAWLDPKTGLGVREGTVVDIVGPRGTYREFVAEFQENTAPLNGRTLSSFNLRSAPFDLRTSGNPLQSAGNGEPSTDAWRAYPGDEVVVRLLYGAQANVRAVGTFGLAGHRFAFEQHLPGSRLLDTLSFGISSQHNLRLECGAGGCDRVPGDYLYWMTQPEQFRQGAWGLLRVHDAAQPDLRPLPDNLGWSAGTLPGGPLRRYDVVAMEANVTYNERLGIAAPTRLFALASEEAAILDGTLRPHPLVLRALPGEVVEVALTNRLDAPVSLHAALLAADPADGLGIPVGANPDTTVAPGGTRTYRWHADAEVGIAHLTSFGAPAQDALEGLYGALVVEPAGSSFDAATGPSANLTLPGGDVVREHVLLYASDDPRFMGSVMPYTVDVQGLVSINYRSEPLAGRLGGYLPGDLGDGDLGGLGVHPCQVDDENCVSPTPKPTRLELRSPLAPLAHSDLFGAPETPVLQAAPGQRVVVRALGGAGDQLQVHAVQGHWWARDPALPGGDLADAATLGPREASNAWFTASAAAGDHLWGSHREAFREAGAWGVLRVER